VPRVSEDREHMRAALALARRGLGVCWPNPAVGCVIVQGGAVVGRAVTAAGGRPHAETQALARAGDAARGATAYVTLEPCSHHGRTPPCADALIAAGIARVVVGARDRDRRVAGSGIARLQAGGVAVEEGVLREEAEEVAAGFFSLAERGRPLVTLKLASTLDGRIATRGGESQWITGEPARRMAHALRGRNDAVMVGVGTVLRDNPDLRCRILGFRQRPVVRVVADGHLRTGLLSRLVSTARAAPVWVLAREDADADRRAALTLAGAEVIPTQAASVGIDAAAALAALGRRGITRVLVEGGAQFAAALLRADLVDRVAWFHAPSVMGGDGWPATAAFGVTALPSMPRFEPLRVTRHGADTLTELRRIPARSVN
jgi:diaminohydroxyphosphoribosylaminopyrimidine deaminase/5-amino-6-(5-phosphoribosylamino)uracil reductase